MLYPEKRDVKKLSHKLRDEIQHWKHMTHGVHQNLVLTKEIYDRMLISMERWMPGFLVEEMQKKLSHFWRIVI